VFIAHSLGGIIVKQALREAEETNDPIFTKTRCVIFLSTPHAGAAIAKADAFVKRGVGLARRGLNLVPVVGGVIGWGIARVANRFRSSALTRQLRKNEGALMDLNYSYRLLSHIDTYAFYETKRTYFVQVVDPASADPGVSERPRRADGKDHITICKPENEQDELFVQVANIIESIRKRVREGRDLPIFHEGIRQMMTDTPFASYSEAGNFADIPPERDVRRRFENDLRVKFRQRFRDGESIEAWQEQAARDSNYDIDKFVLSLWLQKKVSEQLETLSNYISQAEGEVRVAIAAPEPPTLILLYRAARTLEHVLLGFDYGTLANSVKRANQTVNSRCATDKTFDADGATRKLLDKLEFVAKEFDNVKRQAPP
jgi:Putative serine esterase (DUF676)